MYAKAKNPFERNRRDIPLLRFLIHSESLASKVLLPDREAYRLVRLNNFKEIEVVPLPIANSKVSDFYLTNGLILTKYSRCGESVNLEGSDGSIHGVTVRAPDNIWDNIAPDSPVTLADIFTSNNYDYLVVRENDPILGETNRISAKIVTPDQALDITRVLMVSHGYYYISPRTFAVNEGFYYLYRYKKLYKSYQYAWAIAVHAHGKGLSEVTYDQLGSLSRRLEFLCRAYDKIAYYSQKTVNHDIQHNQLYHLAYFVMLCTGVFDNLAHLIEEYYGLQVTSRMNIALRFSKGIKFYKELRANNNVLYNFLSSENVQRQIEAFYPIRDSLQHRELFQVVRFTDASNSIYDKSLIQLSDEAAEKLVEEPSASNCIYSPGLFMGPLPFITWAQGVLVNIVNSVLSLIDWDTKCEGLPEDIKNTIHESKRDFELGVGHLLGWGEEPWYF
ncbi:hypothetical protein ACFLS8_01590 [Chloroflexota bacterium]